MSAASPQPSLFSAPTGFGIRFPGSGNDLEQDQEWFEFNENGRRRKLRLHDYAQLYEVPGLYEALVYDKLACKSPQRLAKLVAAVLNDAGISAEDLRVLDLGAGNGIVAEEFAKLGTRRIVGLDLIPEAKVAAERDRPGLYTDYIVTDLTAPSESDIERLDRHQLNCLVTVAALGFGDIPPEAFKTAFNAIAPNGCVGMTIKEEFLDPDDKSGFGRFVKAMIDEQVIEIQAHQRYCHRLSIAGDRLYYVALVARKTNDIPASLSIGKHGRPLPSHNEEKSGHIDMLLRKSD